MTNEEALEFLDTPEEVRMTTELFEFTQVCKQALEKQIPKKPNDIVCPNCGKLSIHDREYGDELKYCYECGQAIDWSDTK